MFEHTDRWELDVIPPLNSLTITLDVSPPELELAVATSGASLRYRHDEGDRRRHGGRRRLGRALLASANLTAGQSALVGPDMAAVAADHPVHRSAQG